VRRLTQHASSLAHLICK